MRVLLEAVPIAFFALRTNLVRSLLTVLGIIIGVAAVVGVVSIVQGLQHLFTEQMQGVGATYVLVLPNQTADQEHNRRIESGSISPGPRHGVTTTAITPPYSGGPFLCTSALAELGVGLPVASSIKHSPLEGPNSLILKLQLHRWLHADGFTRNTA